MEAHRPQPKHRVWALYEVFSACIRETKHMTPVKASVFSKAAAVLNYENDIAVKLLQSADDFYLKLCAEKTKRMQAK